jgi:DNA-binding Lrp family transcriptional regulator
VIAPAAWRLARPTVLFLFDVARISRGDGDLLEPLLLTAILQANQAALAARPDLQLAYGARAWALPDEERRPISVSALANSLELPFETARRRAASLVARGLCVKAGAGLYAPLSAVTAPAYLAVLSARAARLGRLHAELVAAGLQAPDPQLAAFLAETPRAADRVLGDYMLRTCGELLALAGSAMDGVVLLALCAGNIRDVDPEFVGGWSGFGDTATPCRVTALADALAMPGETVRRHVRRLAAAGFARRSARGWVADAAPDRRAAVERLIETNAQNLRRMLAALGDLAARESAGAVRRA